MREMQDTLRNELGKYVNGRPLSRGDRWLMLFPPRLMFFLNSSRVLKNQQQANSVETCDTDTLQGFNVKPYDGRNPMMCVLQNVMNGKIKQFMSGAYLHGSVGSGEQVAYSDCDALVVLNNTVFLSARTLRRTALKLYKLKKFMFRFDPLQHHGWFVLTEADLQCYPEHYLPLEVIRRSRALFPERGIELNIRPFFDRKKTKENFESFCQGILRKLQKKDFPKNVYTLKGLLSQFMLLPSLYVQVRDSKGIFKKESFAAARKDFTEEEWRIMDEVSAIRENWSYRISPLKKWILTRNSPMRDFLAPRIAPAIPKELHEKLSPDYYARMGKLALSMQEKLT